MRRKSIAAPMFGGLLAVVLGWSAVTLRADVFYRFPLRGDAVLRQLGGTCVYRTEVHLNGAPGRLAAYAFNASASETRKRLTHTFGLSGAPSFGGALISHVEKDKLRRLLVLPAASGESTCVVLAFEQSLREAARAAKPPTAWPEGLPTLAAQPLFSAVCDATHTAFGVAETETSPQDAVRETAQTLRQAGWSELPHVNTATFKTFVSGKKICLLFASQASLSDKTTISVLQRDGAAP